MTASAAYLELVADVLRPSGSVVVRRMFGGAGIYRNGLMFALVADDVLYLKFDTQTAEHFAGEGLEPFVYEKDGRQVAMSYRRAPERVFEDPDEALLWARRAFDAAIRSAAPKIRPRRQPGRRGLNAR
ncbi:MAG: TfoX/Sxy family protein [Hyphomicrobium sp.]|nr:TfoX/Sxy family protein [Hyphomicrobium sp.]